MDYQNAKIDYPCPVCGQRFPVSLTQLFPEEVIICPVCGATGCGSELSEINQAFKKVEIELLNIKKILDYEEQGRESL